MPMATSAQATETSTRQRRYATIVLALAAMCWGFLAWTAIDMSNPFARLTMPISADWAASNVFAIWTMWAFMMAAMMLPSAIPMILIFVTLSERNNESGRGRAFVAAYLVVWFLFSAAATLVQWALQALDWVDAMIVSTSAVLTGVLLLLAGAYQFSPLKRLCLARCRTPLVFVLGEWRPGIYGAYVMGTRHGLFCMGCCWALMGLLFVGGAMNLAWIAAISILVALEKLLPQGQRIAAALGVALLAAGGLKLLDMVA
jgi:predicted metal-binding membrane protein